MDFLLLKNVKAPKFSVFLCIVFLLVIAATSVQAKIIAAYVVPHGGLALDPSHANFTNSSSQALATKIHDNLILASQDVAAQRPDLIFLSTPHGLADLDKFLIYLNNAASGETLADSCTNITECSYKLDVTLAANESLTLVRDLRKNHRVSGISGFGPPGGDPLPPKAGDSTGPSPLRADDSGVPLPLNWAEIIPLYFIPHLNTTKLIIFSHPSRRYNHSEKMIPELLHLGRSTFLRLDHLAERVAVIISADLAHTHEKNGPYGFSPAAQPFDDAVGKYLRTLRPRVLLETAAGLVNDALSCGYTGLVMLHGMLSEGGLKKWRPRLLVNGHPTYYGMAVAIIKR